MDGPNVSTVTPWKSRLLARIAAETAAVYGCSRNYEGRRSVCFFLFFTA